MDEDIQQLTAIDDMAATFIVNYSFQLLGAMLSPMIGFWLGGKIAGLVGKLCPVYIGSI